MLKEVETKISELRALQKDEYYKQKEQDLENWGLGRRKKGKNSVPLIVTDDEYEALIDASIGTKGNGRNTVASLLNAAAIAIIALGIVIGIACVVILDNLGAVYFSVSVVTAIVLALLFRGVAEAITILQQLLDTKRSEDFKKLHGDRRVFPEVQPETTQPFANAPPVHYAYPSDIKTVDMPE